MKHLIDAVVFVAWWREVSPYLLRATPSSTAWIREISKYCQVTLGHSQLTYSRWIASNNPRPNVQNLVLTVVLTIGFFSYRKSNKMWKLTGPKPLNPNDKYTLRPAFDIPAHDTLVSRVNSPFPKVFVRRVGPAWIAPSQPCSGAISGLGFGSPRPFQSYEQVVQ